MSRLFRKKCAKLHFIFALIISLFSITSQSAAEAWPYATGNYDHDGIPDQMVKFDRNAVINLLPNGTNVKITVTGTVNATTYEGEDYIRVKH
ncbi:MAG: hypothetical protein HZB62_04810 [Nitrospirae bacterium]|nr:hypothetical protein [Nitrospirota bacterium]